MWLLFLALAASWGGDAPSFEVRGGSPTERVLSEQTEADLTSLVELAEPAPLLVEGQLPPPPLLGTPLPSGRVVDSVKEAALLDLVRMFTEVGDLETAPLSLSPEVMVLAAANYLRNGRVCTASQIVRALHQRQSLSAEVSEALAWLEPRVALASVSQQGSWCPPRSQALPWQAWVRESASASEPPFPEYLARALASRAALQILLDPEADPRAPFGEWDERNACEMLGLALEIGLEEERRGAAERVRGALCMDAPG